MHIKLYTHAYARFKRFRRFVLAAFMATHARLGEQSTLRVLHADVLKLVLAEAYSVVVP